MMAWLAEQRTFFIWRMVQFWTFLSLLILEIVQLSAYQKDYWEKPANNQVRIWFSEGLSFSLNGYMIFRLNSQWNNSPSKQDILLDWILFVVWGCQSFLNLGPAVSGEGLHCKLGSYDINTLQNQTRCRLFLFSTGLSFFALFTVLVTLTLSILGWRIKRDMKSSSRYGVHNKHHKPSYLVQKGSFNGEPVLFFYSKNRSVSPYSPYTKDTSVNISIPEPEIVATSKYSRDFTISPLDNDQEEKDDSVLKY